MKALLIDTSTDLAVLGVLGESEILETFDHTPRVSSQLFPRLKTLLEQSGGISYIAVGVGPGSYVGTRSGAVIAKALGFALGLPLIALPSPLIFIPLGVKGPFAYLMDAKMGQLALIRGVISDSGAHQISKPILFDKEKLEQERIPFVTHLTIPFPSLPPTPHLQFASQWVQQQLKEGALSTPEGLEVAYLR